MDDSIPMAPPPAAPQNNIPDDVVGELPMNDNSFSDVTGPLGAAPPPPPPGGIPPAPGPQGGPSLDVSGSNIPSGVPLPPSDSGPMSLEPTGAEPKDIFADDNNPLDVTSTSIPHDNDDKAMGFGAPSDTPPPPFPSATDNAVDIPINDAPPAPAPLPPVPSGDPASSDDLIQIKKNALNELNPLVSHLDQPPLERFNTLLDMIRATDDTSLVKPAYEAAHAIPDEKERAKALLEIVKEVNYLTQAKDAPAPPPPAG